MRKANQEIKDPEILEGILSGAEICRIAMWDGHLPYMLPFNFGYREGCIYIHSAPSGKKIDLLRKNGTVCFEVEQVARVIRGTRACNWTTFYRSVIGYGEVDIVTDVEGKKQGLEIIMAQHGGGGNHDFDPREVESLVILRLTITSMTGKQSSNWERENPS